MKQLEKDLQAVLKSLKQATAATTGIKPTPVENPDGPSGKLSVLM